MNERRISEEYEKGVSEFFNMFKNTQSQVTRHIFVLVFVVLIKYVMTWAQCMIIYSSLV